MNCFNHTQEPAVAQCSDCGKGLCSECAERYQPILCTPCFQKRKRSEIWRSIFSLLFLIALFVIGFRWNFLATKGVEDMRWMSGYVLMAIWSGYLWKSHTNLTHPGKYFRPSKVKIMRPTSPK